MCATDLVKAFERNMQNVSWPHFLAHTVINNIRNYFTFTPIIITSMQPVMAQADITADWQWLHVTWHNASCGHTTWLVCHALSCSYDAIRHTVVFSYRQFVSVCQSVQYGHVQWSKWKIRDAFEFEPHSWLWTPAFGTYPFLNHYINA